MWGTNKMKRRSFNSLEHELRMILGRHGYVRNTKLKDLENTDTVIYTKGLLDGCIVSSHRADTSSITVSFSNNYIQMTYSALVVITFDINADIQYIMVDHTDSKRYTAIFTEIKHLIERI